MIAAFDLGGMRCACGSPDVVSIDPGRGPEMDPVFNAIMLQRAVAARAWCGPCFAAFAAQIPHEEKKKQGRMGHG